MTRVYTPATHCHRGHPLSGDNLRKYFVDGRLKQRICVQCRTDNAADRSTPPVIDEARQRRLFAAWLDKDVTAQDLDERGFTGLEMAEARKQLGPKATWARRVAK